MRHIFAYFILIATAACAPTTDQLFAQANQTGDFTAVNKRLAEDERTLASPEVCPRAAVLYCEVRFGNESCSCEMLPERSMPIGTAGHRRMRRQH